MTRVLLLRMRGTGLVLPAAAQDTTRGQALFDAQCSRCHRGLSRYREAAAVNGRVRLSF